MKRTLFWTCLMLGLGFGAWGLVAAGTDQSRCVTCAHLLPEKFYWFDGPTLPAKQPVCEPCSKLPSRCAVCRLPVRQQGQRLEDGRWLCQQDFRAGIFTAHEAARVYEETRREVEGILAGYGVLPADIKVSLVDGRELRKENQAMPSAHEDGGIQGLTRTRWLANRQFQHQILVLSGLSRARLAAVCAHEYTHAWLHENVPESRALERDTVEGFCELVAYKLMARRSEGIEKKVILANAYTRGQVNAFVQAEGAQHFQRIVEWMKTGVDNTIRETSQGVALDLEERRPAEICWPPPALVPTSVPEVLSLKGISGRHGRRFALINDCTLMANESGRVRLGTSNVWVKCIEVRERSALIQVDGSPHPAELFLQARTPGP